MKVRFERYASKHRHYLKDGREVAGCSTISKLGDNPEPLLRWANREGLAGRDCTRTKDKASDVGNISHFLIKCFLRQDTPDLRECEDSDIAKGTNSFEKFLKFWEKEKLVHVESEVALVSEVWEYGGQLDTVARDEDGLLVMLDYKSAKKDIYFSHKCQIAGYEGLWQENRDEPIKRRAVVRIPYGTETDTAKPHWITTEQSRRYLKIFRKQADLYNTIKKNK